MKGHDMKAAKERKIERKRKHKELSVEKTEKYRQKKIDNKTYSIGGRVINFVSLSESFKESRNRIFNIIKSLNWDGGFFRKDIGYKVIDE